MSWIKDPLVIFLVVGTSIFWVAKHFGEDDIPYGITISEQDLSRLSEQWNMQMRRPPSAQELSGLVEQFIREEIYYREARRLGLDADDTIVRRRMVQKLTFLTEDIATAAPPDEAGLRSYYDEHIEDYRLPERISFKHRYFSSDRRADAQADATAALEEPEASGDAFMLQREYAMRSAREVRDLFGSNFATALMELSPAEHWQGPVQSAYGWHAVLISHRVDESVQPFEQVRERVLADAQQALRQAANEAYFEQLKSRYHISYPQPAGD